MMRLTHTHTLPEPEGTVPRLEQRLDRADWDHLREERVAIMVESGIGDSRALALATHDTTVIHGVRPVGYL